MIDEGLLVCRLCEKRFSHLGSHIWHKHKITAREYKEQFGLNYNQPLISQEIYEKKSEHWQENREKYLANAMKNLKKYQFKKGTVNRHRFADQDIERIVGQAEKINSKEWRLCPVCGVKYQRLDNHLLLKHNLLEVKK